MVAKKHQIEEGKQIGKLANFQVLILWAGPSVVGLITAKVIASAIILAVLLLFVYRWWLQSGVSLTVSKNQFRNILATALPFSFASLASILSINIDKVIVSSKSTAEVFAVYVNGAIEIPLIGIVVGSITAISLAEMAKRIEENKTHEGKRDEK